MLDPMPGQAVYSPSILAVYDTAVLRISQPYAWGCPSSKILDLYEDLMADDHLDIGVGTGYFLRRVRKPINGLTLFDLNVNSLYAAERKLRQHNPVLVRGNVLDHKDMPEGTFGSVGMNCLLHCLPGKFADKGEVFANVKTVMRPGAWLFGSTVPGALGGQNLLGKLILRSYNRRGIWSNLEDDLDGLHAILSEHFTTYDITMVGKSALFKARKD